MLEINNVGIVYCIGGGSGIPEVYQASRAFKDAGNRVIGIIGSRSKDQLILEKEMRSVCDELFITTEDGSYGTMGMVTDVLKELFSVIEKSTHTEYPGMVYCAGPLQLAQAVAEITKDCGVKTIARIDPVISGALGLQGGPDFDAHLVDFNELVKKQQAKAK